MLTFLLTSPAMLSTLAGGLAAIHLRRRIHLLMRFGEIIPIHDGYAKDFFLKQRYENFEKLSQSRELNFTQWESREILWKLKTKIAFGKPLVLKLDRI